jgi:hypothetical protein
MPGDLQPGQCLFGHPENVRSGVRARANFVVLAMVLNWYREYIGVKTTTKHNYETCT